MIVDFDRTLIVSEEVPEAGPAETGTTDSGGTDSATDATTDATTDAAPDAASDAPADVQDASDSG